MDHLLKKLAIFFCIALSQTIFSFNYITYGSTDLSSETFFITNSGGYTFYNSEVYQFNALSSIPMIKIVASDIVIDFNNIGITNITNGFDNIVGIEIGWTPEELAEDTNRVQPKNIIIKNLSLNQFDCGIIIHEGVKIVSFETININNTCVGIVCAGTSENNIEELKLSNISIFGDKLNHHSCLVSLKTLIETTYGYGADYFNKLVADPFNGNVIDVYTYYGIWINESFKILMNNIFIKNVGYDYTGGSEGNGNRTQASGLVVKNSKQINLNKVLIQNILSEIKAAGLVLDHSSGIDIKKSNFSYNVSGKRALGIEITNETLADYSVTDLEIDEVETQNHISNDIALGMDLSSVRGLAAYNLSCKFNKGLNTAYGIYLKKGYTCDFKTSTLSENTATNQTNNVITTSGIAAYGFYGEDINSIQFGQVDFCSMQGLNSAYGIYLKNSTSCRFDTCQFIANIATQMRSGEAADIRTAQDAQEISKHAPVADAASTGGYGVFMTGTNYVKFQDCLANSNSGHRAIGMNFKNCRAIAIYNTFASTQYATGTMLDTSFMTDNIANPSAISIKTPHIPLFFGGLSKTTIDALTTTDIFLEKMSSIRADQMAGNNPSYNDLIAISATSSLLEAMVARYRLWGVAIGIHANNVTGFLLKDCTCVGNISIFDNGVGLCFTGRNTDHTVRDSNLAFNAGGVASLITAASPGGAYSYSYNLMGMKIFWSTLLQTDIWTNLTNTSVGSDVKSVSLSPDGTKLAVGMANNNIVILNPVTGATITTLTGHTAAITSVRFSPDGTQLATSSSSATNNIKIWNTTSWVNTQTLTHVSSGVLSLAWNPAGTQLASGAIATVSLLNIALWSTSTWLAVGSTTQGISGVGVTALAYNDDGSRLVSGSDQTSNNIRVWNVTIPATPVLVDTLSSHTNAITSLAFNPAYTLLASGSLDDTVKIWTVASWSLAQTISASAGDVNAVRFKNDGKLLASAHGDNSVRIWSTTDWSSVKVFTDHTQAATALTWSADGKRIVTGSNDDYVKYYSTNIYSKATTTAQPGIYNPSIYFTVQGQKQYGNESVGNDVFIRLKSADRALISPIGPVGAGIIMGDLLLEGVVQSSNLYGNVGNAGYSSGIILDNTYSVTLDSNLISGNIANVYGVTAGIQDRTAHSPNLFMKNFFEGNKCSIFNNSNYFIPFNPADSNDLAFPVTTMYNGSFVNLDTLFDNIEVLYSQNPQFYNIEYISSVPTHPDLTSYLTSQNCWA